MARHSTILTLCTGLAFSACGETQTISQVDPPPAIECAAGEIARNGTCFCQTDRACPAGEVCDVVTGRCGPKKEEEIPDAGFRPCINGARRCAPSPLKAIQECQNNEWIEVETCPPEGSCSASATGYYCAICASGTQRCKGDDEVEVCSEKGDEWIASICPTDPATGEPAACVNDRCRVCTPGTVRCSEDGSSLETCQEDGLGWITQFCFPTGQCDPAARACVPPFCQPGSRQCKDGNTVSICAADGSKYEDRDCRTIDTHSTQAAICRDNDCFDPCGDAARNSSYQGCDYWATTTSNMDIDAPFKGNAADGTQPTSTSQFALAISNPNSTSVNVRVTRMRNGVEETSPSNPAANAQGYISIAPGQLQLIRLPWQAVKGTGKQRQAFHITSNLPVTAYQFNPVVAYTGSGLTRTYSYTNDASLLLPSHILGTSYVVLAQEHITIASATSPACSSDEDCPGPGNRCEGFLFTTCRNPPVLPAPAFFSVVGTEDNTQVTIRFSGATLATQSGGVGNIPAQTRNTTRTYTLNKYEVLQFLSEVEGQPAACTKADASWANDVCRYDSDLTGSIVSSDKPVAVFGGADCTFKPYNKFACDHIEEQMMPFETWGKAYVGVRTAPYKDSRGNLIPESSRSPDYWRVVAGCGKASCPNGTRVTINPSPASYIQSGLCSGNVCTLPPIDATTGNQTAPWVEFTHRSDFVATADQPIMLAQYFSGSNANAGSDEGDPSMVLTPPVEQWRMSYNVVTSNTYKSNYLLIATQSTAPNIEIDGKALTPANFPGMTSNSLAGGFTVYRVPVPGKSLTVTGTSRFGVVVAGFDSYVSYGYPGGLDLMKITQINPGG